MFRQIKGKRNPVGEACRLLFGARAQVVTESLIQHASNKRVETVPMLGTVEAVGSLLPAGTS
jgi:hypothetical protein